MARLKWIIILLISVLGTQARAQEFSGSSLKIIDPVIAPSNYSTSTSFGLWSTLGQISTGTSTSAGFGVNSGFLYFPTVTTPAVSATAGDAQVALSWTTSTGFLGWTVSGYTVGQSTTSGGPYTYSTLGSVTSSTRTGLTNSTPYYFVIRVQDAFSNFVATSSEVTATPVGTAGGGDTGGSGSSGGGSTRTFTVNLSGLAYPNQPVTIMVDGLIEAEVVANLSGQFTATIDDVTIGTKIFAVYAVDTDGRQSKTVTIPVIVKASEPTQVTGIFIPPTITSDKEQVKSDEVIIFSGQGSPLTLIELTTAGALPPLTARVQSDALGRFSYKFKTLGLPLGQYETSARAITNSGLASQLGLPTLWRVGLVALPRPLFTACPKPGDLNKDCRVNLSDFSILVYWHERANWPATVDLKTDGKIDLKDFAVVAYYWTG